MAELSKETPSSSNQTKQSVQKYADFKTPRVGSSINGFLKGIFLEDPPSTMHGMEQSNNESHGVLFYNHSVLVTRVELGENQTRLQWSTQHIDELNSTKPIRLIPRIQCYLHHWGPTNSENSVSIHTTLTPENLSRLDGFRELGTFSIPLAFVDSPKHTIHQYLSTIVSDIREMLSQPSEEAIINGIAYHLTSTPPTSPLGIFVKLYKISITSSSQNSLFDGSLNIWKWVDFAGFHRKAGWWTSSLEEAVIDGEGATANNLQLLVHGIKLGSDKEIEKTESDIHLKA
ncbi:hypothetical protein F5884DRAFT_894917 [Xylogone sp. PMI_703]|nr:hypothetical protein F5884DRAFT_894917 [Xylogone sp. PMI_703]